MANVQNLIPIKTLSNAEAKKRGKLGGIASVKARREKKLMSQIYADILAEQTGQKKGLDLKAVVKNILQEGGASAVSMIKEIREATEGSKTQLTGGITIVIDQTDNDL